MDKSSIVSELKALKPILNEKFGIKKFAIFGSVARGDFNNNSDIDIAIFQIDRKDFFKRVEAKNFLEKRLGKRVDIGYFDSMREAIKDFIKKDLIFV
jgi:predicted nucleotidyltransferase